jgi:hypothetical protein
MGWKIKRCESKAAVEIWERDWAQAHGDVPRFRALAWR